MSSNKVILCDLCTILLFGLVIGNVLSDPPADESRKANYYVYHIVEPNLNEEGAKGNCSCGGFPSSTPVAGSAPLLSQSPGLVVKCDQEGDQTCMNLCLALASATKAKGPEILCNRLENADELKLSAFYKTCENPWTYANMTADQALCCLDKKVKACASVAAGNATEAGKQ